MTAAALDSLVTDIRTAIAAADYATARSKIAEASTIIAFTPDLDNEGQRVAFRNMVKDLLSTIKTLEATATGAIKQTKIEFVKADTAEA